MDSSIITVLAIILLILIVLNHITVISPTISTNASCSQTSFGCCPNGVDSKINYYGTNCPGYRPGPGYQPQPVPPPYVPPPYVPPPPVPGPKPIGGCAGTRYGCCPNNNTPKINQQGSNCLLK
jgi:hypothetical protein